MPDITIKQMLEAGSHFGHQTKRWNPKMKKYIFGARNGIYIIDLHKSIKLFNEAYSYVKDITSAGNKILFVGTKKQAQDVIVSEAQRCGMHYINQRWLGGMLTNFKTINKSIKRLKTLEEQRNNGSQSGLTKKEILKLSKEEAKLEKYFNGIKNMNIMPSAIFIVDPRKEKIAFQEAKKLNIKIVAIVDTNCDPEGIDYIIPGNDDAIRAIKLITSNIANAAFEGKTEFEERQKVIREQELKEKEIKRIASEKIKKEAAARARADREARDAKIAQKKQTEQKNAKPQNPTAKKIDKPVNKSDEASKSNAENKASKEEKK